MNDERDRGGRISDDEWIQFWQMHAVAAPDPDLHGRLVLTQVRRFDQKVWWRNFREYAAGLILMGVFAGLVVLGHDRRTGAIGFVCVGFVMAQLWWRHRRLKPLDPAADIATYRAALLKRYDDQIGLLRTMPYWYLLPLFVPALSIAVSVWPRSHARTSIFLAIVAAAYVFVGWLNVRRGVGMLRASRARIESMLPQE